MRIMACSEKSKNFKKWQQTNMKNYFIVKNSATKKIYCEDCRRKFQSVYHLNHHLSSAIPCRDAYDEPSIDEPHTLLQHMPEEVLYLVSDFLLYIDLVNFICALPRLLVCHGMKVLWMRRMNRRHPRFNPYKMHVSVYWLLANELKVLRIENFLIIRLQGENSRDYADVVNYHDSVYRTFRKGGTCRRARIWNIKQYLIKYDKSLWRPGPLNRWILF